MLNINHYAVTKEAGVGILFANKIGNFAGFKQNIMFCQGTVNELKEPWPAVQSKIHILKAGRFRSLKCHTCNVGPLEYNGTSGFL